MPSMTNTRKLLKITNIKENSEAYLEKYSIFKENLFISIWLKCLGQLEKKIFTENQLITMNPQQYNINQCQQQIDFQVILFSVNKFFFVFFYFFLYCIGVCSKSKHRKYWWWTGAKYAQYNHFAVHNFANNKTRVLVLYKQIHRLQIKLAWNSALSE